MGKRTKLEPQTEAIDTIFFWIVIILNNVSCLLFSTIIVFYILVNNDAIPYMINKIIGKFSVKKYLCAFPLFPFNVYL